MLIDSLKLSQNLLRSDWVVFDCRHDLADHARGGRVYRESHIPGAHFAPVETALAGAKSGSNGRHPLPNAADFAAFLSRHGVSDSTQIVAYDDAGSQYAARLWWMARWIGHTRTALLDGGWPKWLAEGRPVTADVPRVAPSAPLLLRADESRVWTLVDVQQKLPDSSFAMIDARSSERYRGEVEPIDPVAGHIPGALNRFFRANLNADQTFRPAADLRREFKELIGPRTPERVGHQCGSGITACVNLFAMEYAGLSGSKLYVGSWSEWIADSSRPVTRGAA